MLLNAIHKYVYFFKYNTNIPLDPLIGTRSSHFGILARLSAEEFLQLSKRSEPASLRLPIVLIEQLGKKSI